jgi:hypothetical protein
MISQASRIGDTCNRPAQQLLDLISQLFSLFLIPDKVLFRYENTAFYDDFVLFR